MFFKAIAPLLQKGVKFTLQIEAADADLIAVSVLPSTSSKTGHALTAKQFVATAQEFDAQFVGVMEGFASMTRTLNEQLEDARLVSDAAAQAAADEAAKSAKKAVAKKPIGKPAPSALVSGNADEDDEEAAETEGSSDAPASSTPAVAEHKPAQAGFVL